MSLQKIVLNVEDNLDNRILIRRLLEAAGYRLLEAGDAAQALARLKDTPVDLILMDINMPDVDGYTLTAKLKANPAYAAIPIVALTANVMKGDREKTLRAGCDGYIEKPIDVDNFTAQVESFLRKP
jgi:two-component system cell cycle response regulator DivK